MKKLKNTIGMTLAELLLVVAIIGVLGGVAVVAVVNHQRSLGQLERDGIAKEIFIAAQNHLTMAYGEGYPGVPDSGFGEEDTISKSKDKDGEEKDIQDDYYFVVNGNIPENTALDEMLPFGAIDETVRMGGSYIIHYQRGTGLVLDVFYCSMGSGRFDHKLNAGEYATVLRRKDTETENHKSDRHNWNGKILGWYGGADAALLPTTTLKTPKVEVENSNTLSVKAWDLNSTNPDASLKLIVEGQSSGAKLAFPLEKRSVGRVEYFPTEEKYIVTLDDITVAGMNFAELPTDNSVAFIPGENITVRAVAYSKNTLANIASSPRFTTNSLFAALEDTDKNNKLETVLVSNIRHLENLDASVSNLGAAPAGTPEKFRITAARQTQDLSWTEFKTAVSKDKPEETRIYYTDTTAKTTEKGCFYPVSPDYALDYDGQSNSITDIKVKCDGDAGLFGQPGKELDPVVINIKNLELIDFSVTGGTSAGALVGSLAWADTGSGVTNVLVRNSDSVKDAAFGNFDGKSPNVEATGATSAAGGLIGESGACAVTACAAAVYVKGEDAVGGLIGCAGNSGTVTACYSAGHTKNGSYAERIKTNGYDVSGGTVGGLIGVAGGAKVTGSYSTCSVSGTTAGGLAGSAAGAIKDSYAAGLVTGTGRQFAFLGSGSLPAGSTGNYYYRAINEVETTGVNGKVQTEPLLPVSGYVLTADMASVKPLDLNAEAYNAFTGVAEAWGEAKPYDEPLTQYFYGRYNLQNVRKLYPTYFYSNGETFFACTHYGDWPSPEVFFLNMN